MLPRRLAWLAILFGWAVPLFADTYPRQAAIDIQHYEFRLTLRDDTDDITGQTIVDVRFVQKGVTAIVLDLVDRAGEARGMTVTSVSREGSPLRFAHSNGRLEIRLASPSRAEERQRIAITYGGRPGDGLIIGANRHGDRVFFGDNFPDRARHWLPTLDHPSDKATCEFAVTAPAVYQVIATGRLVEETDLDGGRRLTRWRGTVPIATYLMVIGVARFAVEQVDRLGDVPIQTWVYRQDRDSGFHDFARARQPLAFFVDRIGPYPYEKLANVQSKTRYGGMENAGNIFYSEGAIRGDRGVEGTVVHEVAHQWFGDSVTESDWNHVWLSEGFATYFTHLYHEYAFGRDRLVEDLRRDREAIARFRDRNSDLRIVDDRVPIDRVLSTYTYQKGGWVLHMLRRRVGDEAFWAGIREYYGRYRDGNALSEDFVRIMEETSRQDLSAFFHQWLYEPGHPRLEGAWRYEAAARRVTVMIRQTQQPLFDTPIDIGLVVPGGSRRVETVQLRDAVHAFTFSLETAPVDVVLDPDVWLLMEGRVGTKVPG